MATKDVKGELPAPVDDDTDAPATSEVAGETTSTYRQPKNLRQIARDLWRQKPGVRESKADSGPVQRALSAKEVVNGLDRRELLLGTALMVIDLALTLIVYFYWRHSTDVKAHQYAPDFLIAGLVGVGIMAFGAALKRRALLGFAAFIVGMELISFGLVYGILYLFFGGWLVVRVMRKQRQDQARGKYTGTIDAGARSRRGASTGAPSASKRYTPPRRVKTTAKKR